MLYHMHELHHASVAPLRVMAEATRLVFTNRLLPVSHTRLGRTIAASCEMLERTTRRYPKPSFNLPHTVIDGQQVAVREVMATRKRFCTLLHFERDTQRQDPKVLLVAPMSGHFATLLRGTVETLLPDNDVYITDWRCASQVPVWHGLFDLDDYIDYIRDFIHFLGPNTHVIAVCQPSVPVLAAVSLMAAEDDPLQPSSMTLMGGPIDARRSPTKVNDVATEHPLSWFQGNVIQTVPLTHPGAGRRVYPGFLQLSGFMSMNIDRHVDAHLRMFQHLVRGDGDDAEQHRAFYDEYLSVMDLTAEFYLQTIRTVFQEYLLPRGLMTHRGTPVNPAAIRRTALMTVEGEKDDITGGGQTLATQDLCSRLPDTMRRHHLQPQVGHYGVFNGRRWRTEIYPQVRDFIRTHDRAESLVAAE